MRRAAVTVSIKGHDVTLDLMPYLVSLTYTDKADEELDDLQIVLEDREGIWQGDWTRWSWSQAWKAATP